MSKKNLRRFGASEAHSMSRAIQAVPRPPEDCDIPFGFSERPYNINDIAPGDAAAGLSRYRRGKFFTQLATIDSEGAPVVSAAELVWNRAIGIATDRSSDMRPRFFHVSFFGNGVIREVPFGSTVSPLSPAEIQSASNAGPSISLLRGRVLIQDESGGRFFDVDTMGTRSFSIYAFAVTVFILLPQAPDGTQLGQEVDQQDPGQTLIGTPGTVEDAYCSARVIPVFQNATQIVDNITRTVQVPADGTNFIEIPPGTTRVQIRSSFDRTAVPADYSIGFSIAPTLTAANAMGQIFMIPGTVETDTIEVPNSKFIVFIDSPLEPLERNWIVTFIVEA